MNQIEKGQDAEAQMLRVSPAQTPGAIAPSIPEHQLVCLIAAGAYGEVWLGLNPVETPRAVKIVRRDQHTTTESFEREFKGLQNFEPISRSHEGLVDILTLGLLPDETGFYYVMELADAISIPLVVPKSAQAQAAEGTRPVLEQWKPGLEAYAPRTLRAELRTRSALPATEVIELGLKLTAALASLHGHGLVHRDVKPSNILFIGGEPKLADAGLVAAMDDAHSLVGTAGYIAPEGPGTPQADLYALSKVLYEAAFGKDRQEFPSLPVDVASRADHARLLELNAILLKACATSPHERYASAAAMRADLEMLRAGQSVKWKLIWQRILNHARKLALAFSALAIISGLSYWLTVGQTRKQTFVRSKNEEANREYSEGFRLLHSGPGGLEAIEHFERAIALDPNFAEAYARMAFAWLAFSGQTNVAKAREAAEKAIALNPTLAAAHAFLASVKAHEFDWAGAEKERTLALKLNPNSEEILLESALNLAVMGRTKEALASIEKAQRVNADSSSNLRALRYGLVYGWTRQYDRAIEIFGRFPDRGWLTDERYADAYLAKGDSTNAMRLGKKAALGRGEDLKQVNAEFDALEKAYNEGGPERYWRLKLEFEMPKTDDNHLMRMAADYARLNDGDKAFECLFRAREETPKRFLTGFMTNPSFDTLRNEQRVKEMSDGFWHKK